MKQNPPVKQNPVVQSILLADRAFKDARDNKHTVVGIFNKMLLNRKLPKVNSQHEPQNLERMSGDTQVGTPYAYFSLTEVYGEILLELRFVDLREDKILLQTSFRVAAKEALDTVEGILPMPKLPVNHEGTYALELLSDNELLGYVRLVVEKENVLIETS